METSSKSPKSEADQTRNCLDLPRDVTIMILQKLNPIEIITSAQFVCSLWRYICKDPMMWRTIDMQNLGNPYHIPYDLKIMCRHAIDLSCGQVFDISIKYLGNDDLVCGITRLVCLIFGRYSGFQFHLVCCYSISDKGLSEAVVKLPLLEELDISLSSLTIDSLEAVGQYCPLLKSLKFNNQGYKRPHIECDDEAFTIAENMPDLRHLQLFGNKLTNVGLLAILDGCRHPESLDLRQCFNVNILGSLAGRCAEQNIYLRLPNDPTDDYQFGDEILDYGSSDEDYLYWIGTADMDLLTDDDYDHYSD